MSNSDVLLRLENDEFGLSSGEESDFEGEEVHGYLPSPSILLSDSDDNAAPGFSAAAAS